MFTRQRRVPGRSKKLLATYNMIVNLFWAILNLMPISVFCYTLMEPLIFSIFLVLSLAPMFFTKPVINKFQIGKTTSVYKRLGVHLVNNVTQNGIIINALVKKKYPEHKIVKANRTSVSGLINQTYMFERFHLMMFLFFSMTMIYAVVTGYLLWAFIILLTNIIFNIYPNLLQQYIRLKLVLFSKKIID